MNKLSKKSLNAVLALLMAMSLTGCSLFGDDEEESKKTETNEKNPKKDDDKKDSESTDAKKDKDKDENSIDDEEEPFINYTGAGNSYTPSYNNNASSQNKPSSEGGSKPSIPSKPEESIKTDFTQLHSLLMECKNIDTSKYTPNSVSIFENAIKHAENVLNITNSSQTVVNQEVLLLQFAKAQLTLKADFTALAGIIDEGNKVDFDKYTPISVNSLKNVINTSKEVLNNKNATQSKVDVAVVLMKEAMKSLVLRADFNDLSKTMAKAKLIKDKDYTDASLAKMYESLKRAESILSNLNASQKAVDEANKDLQDKLNTLVAYVAPDTTDLINLITQAIGYKENEYSIISFTSLKRAIKEAEDTLTIKKVTDVQITNAKEGLQKAINELTVDITSLTDTLDVIKQIDKMLYTPSSYQKVKDAIDSTEIFLETTHKQFEIDAQEKVLTDSVKQLVKRANKTDLLKAINDAKVTYTGDYTVETMNVLKSTVSSAEAIYNNAEATQDEVSNATQNVKDAISQLKVVIHKENLQLAIDKVKDVKENEFTPNTYSAFKTAYDHAITINSDEDATQQQVDDCTTVLENAFASLIKRANISLLNQKITEANAIIQDNYTDTSLVDFNKELTKATELVKDLNITQEKIDEQLTALTNAMNNLVAYVAPNLDAINQAINDAENTTADDWSTASYNTMLVKLNPAKEIINKKKVTQAEIDEAKDELLNAYTALSVDFSILNNTLDNAKVYQEINYTLDSYKVLQDAITHTEDFLKAIHKQYEVNAEATSLQDAIDQLVLFEEEDKTALINAITEAKKINENAYTPNSYQSLATAITKAEVVKNNYRAISTEISTAINELDSTKANLVKRAIVTALNEAITEAKANYAGQFTTSSLDALKTTVTEGETILNNANASQSEVDTKTQNIKTAIVNLVRLGDKTALANMISELDVLQASDYTPVSWASASLGSVLVDAIVIRDKAEATDDEVNAALDSLSQAKAKLVKKADVTDLSSEITKAQAELLKGYTTISKDALNEAITKAQEVVNNPNATAPEVSSTLSTLRDAIAGLKVDVTPLSNEINATKAVDTTNKLPSTITALQNAIKEAEIYRDSSNVTFDGMNEQIQKLKDAVSGLKDKTDTSALTIKLSEAKALKEADYTTDSYAKLLLIINEVEQALLNESISIEQVTQLVSKLDTAMNELEFIPTVANKRKECEQLIVQGKALLNNPLFQAPKEYINALKDEVEFIESVLGSYTDDEFSVEELQSYINNIKEAMKNFNDNLYDVEGLILQCQTKIAEARAMDTTGFSENSVNSMLYYATHLEESITNGQTYEYLQSAYGWLVDAINDLAPADTTVYVNEQAPSEVLTLLNAERKKLGLTELVMDAKLCEATAIRATEAKDQTGAFLDWAHKRPDGRKWNTILDEIGYHQSYAGENAASAFASGSAVYNAWYNSQGHKDNMLDSQFTKVGISMIKVGDGQWVSYMILAK